MGREGVSPIEESTLKPRCQGVRTLVFSSGKRLFLLVGFLAAFVVVLNVSTFVVYDRAKSHLDNELGERLRAIATTLSRAVELSSPDGVSVEGVDASLLTMLHLVQSENSLSNIVILTPEGRPLVDLVEFSERGEMNPFIELDYSAVALARAGIPATRPGPTSSFPITPSTASSYMRRRPSRGTRRSISSSTTNPRTTRERMTTRPSHYSLSALCTDFEAKPCSIRQPAREARER